MTMFLAVYAVGPWVVLVGVITVLNPPLAYESALGSKTAHAGLACGVGCMFPKELQFLRGVSVQAFNAVNAVPAVPTRSLFLSSIVAGETTTKAFIPA